MIVLSVWCLIGAILGSIAGTVITDLTREDVQQDPVVEKSFRFWRWSPQQTLITVSSLWAAFLTVSLIATYVPWQFASDQVEWWKSFIVGTIAGFLAAPWIWLHFVRSFDTDLTQRILKKEEWILARAYEIWVEAGKPEGQADKHYYEAKSEIEQIDNLLIQTSTAHADRQLARYRLLSILLGILLGTGVLLPTLKDWLPRAQQFQAFGVSLTLLTAQRNNQIQIGTPLFTSGATPSQRGEDRLSSATSQASSIGRQWTPSEVRQQIAKVAPFPDPELLAHPSAVDSNQKLDAVGADLAGFQNLSMIDRDRTFVSWFTYEWLKPEAARNKSRATSGQHSFNTLNKYITEAEILLRTDAVKEWHDPYREWDFADKSVPLSACLHEYARKVHDPDLFAETVGHFLRDFARQVKGEADANMSTDLLSILAKLFRGSSINIPIKECNGIKLDWITEIELIETPAPYPVLIAANYLAAVGSVDTGVFIIEDWIRKFRAKFDSKDHPFQDEYHPQLAWYLYRAETSAVDLPYQFGGFAPTHRQLLRWQIKASNRFATLLKVGTAEQWKDLCRRVSFPTIHNKVGRWLLYHYATARFYLFENLEPRDFENEDGLLSEAAASKLLQEAEAIRDRHDCLEGVPDFKKNQKQYEAYFNLYSEQLRFAIMGRQQNKAERRLLLDKIKRGLNDANTFGIFSASASSEENISDASSNTLLGPGDVWDKHKVRLKVLKDLVEGVETGE